MKKVIAFLLCFIILLSSYSCGAVTDDSTAADTTESEDTTVEEYTPVITEGNGKHVLIFIMGNKEANVSATGRTILTHSWEYNNHNPNAAYEDGKRDIASVYYPSVGVYTSSDPEYIEYMLQTFKMCYIDSIDFYLESPEKFEVFAKNFADYYEDMLKKYGMTATGRAQYSDKATASQETFNETFNRILQTFKNVQLTLSGKPVLVQFKFDGITSDAISAWKENYRSIYGVTPMIFRQYSYSGNAATTYKVVDGFYSWSAHGEKYPKNGEKDEFIDYLTLEDAKANFEADMSTAKERLANGTISFYASSVMPGFDDRGVWGWGKGPKMIERGDGELYEYKWQRSIEEDVQMVCIPTWDDWGEGTCIEPSLEFGTQYLEITRKYAAAYKGITANTGDLELPMKIYKIRKSTSDETILTAMKTACNLISAERYDEASAIVDPIAASLGIGDAKTFFDGPKTRTTLIEVKETTPSGGVVKRDGMEVFSAVDDTYTQKSKPAVVTFSTEEVIRVKKDNNSGITRNLYIKFDTSATELQTLEKATLRLYISYANSSDTTRDLNLYATSTDWQGNKVSYNKAPEQKEKVADVKSEGLMNDIWLEIDVTDYMKAHLGETVSFMMINEGADSSGGHVDFVSSEGANHTPELVLG